MLREKTQVLLNRAASDPALRKSLSDNPAETLAQAGLPIKQGTDLRVVSDTADTIHFVIPPNVGGQGAKIADKKLSDISGGGFGGGFGVCLFTIGSTASSLDPHGGFDQ